jgi:hypothetical protein
VRVGWVKERWKLAGYGRKVGKNFELAVVSGYQKVFGFT